LPFPCFEISSFFPYSLFFLFSKLFQARAYPQSPPNFVSAEFPSPLGSSPSRAHGRFPGSTEPGSFSRDISPRFVGTSSLKSFFNIPRFLPSSPSIARPLWVDLYVLILLFCPLLSLPENHIGGPRCFSNPPSRIAPSNGASTFHRLFLFPFPLRTTIPFLVTSKF